MLRHRHRPTQSSVPHSRLVDRIASLATIITGRRSKWFVLGAWLILIAVASPFAGRVGEIEENDAAAYLPRTAESTEALDVLTGLYGDETVMAVFVYARSGGLTEADRSAVHRDREALAHFIPGEHLPEMEVSDDSAALLVTVPLRADPDDDDAVLNQVRELRNLVGSDAPEGLSIYVGGPAGALLDTVSVFDDIDTTLLLVTASVVAVLLLIIYRSPVLWLFPIVAVGIASQAANALVYLLARYADLTVTGLSAGILTVLIFGAGTDYALLLLSRYREELQEQEDHHVAMAIALRRAGPAIAASAATTMVGLLCLLVAELNSTRGLGPVAAAGIVCAFLAMTTLLPAVLVVLGRWIFWPFVPRAGTAARTSIRVWPRVAAWVGQRPRPIWMGTAAILVALVFGMERLETGLTAANQFTTAPESVRGQEVISAHFPAGASAPAFVVADARTETELVEAMLTTPGVASVQPALDAPESGTGDPTVVIPVILDHEPTSRAAEETILQLRQATSTIPAANALVGGETAVSLDTRVSAERDERIIIPLVLLAVFVIVALLLRSLIGPALLVITGVLSFLAAVGGSLLAFDWIFGFEAVDHAFLVLGFIFLVALSIDYNIFLLTRVREEVAAHGHREGVLRGLSFTGGVITSAGVVLAATFAVLTIFPLVFLVQLGVLVAFGVLLDAIVVRTLLVPALALEIGPRLWLPTRPANQRRDSAPTLAPARAD
jgi:putative drug exporter of the RND superfamily